MQNTINLKNHNAFSLIELSIVLIIIGLLIAAVTSGTTLVRNAKIRNFINELKSYKTSMYTFVSLENKLPGDVNMDGVIGRSKGDLLIDEPTSDEFGGKYNGLNVGWRVGPFVDLYLQKLINFEPLANEANLSNNSFDASLAGINFPISKSFKTLYNGFYSHTNTNIESTSFAYKILNGIHIWLTNADEPLKAEIVQIIDGKIDDGLFQTGELRGGCYDKENSKYVEYDYAKTNQIKCKEMEYRVIPF